MSPELLCALDVYEKRTELQRVMKMMDRKPFRIFYVEKMWIFWDFISKKILENYRFHHGKSPSNYCTIWENFVGTCSQHRAESQIQEKVQWVVTPLNSLTWLADKSPVFNRKYIFKFMVDFFQQVMLVFRGVKVGIFLILKWCLRFRTMLARTVGQDARTLGALNTHSWCNVQDIFELATGREGEGDR